MILDRGSTRQKAKSTAGQGPAPGASHEERAGEQTDAADEARLEWSLAADLCVRRTPRRRPAMRPTAHKPTFASVTTKPCTCNWPRDVSREPENSVRFDESTGEYEFVTPSGGRLNIYHCPFCGGAMPRSRRAELFE